MFWFAHDACRAVGQDGTLGQEGKGKGLGAELHVLKSLPYLGKELSQLGEVGDVLDTVGIVEHRVQALESDEDYAFGAPRQDDCGFGGPELDVASLAQAGDPDEQIAAPGSTKLSAGEVGSIGDSACVCRAVVIEVVVPGERVGESPALEVGSESAHIVNSIARRGDVECSGND